MCQPMPVGFPVNLLKPNRALAYIHRKHPQHLHAAIDALWAEFWGREVSNVNVANPDTAKDGNAVGFVDVLRQALPKDVAEDVIGNWNGAEAKAWLVENTARVEKEEEAFGAPWFSCVNSKGEKEGFWGVDHLGCVVRFMGLESKSSAKEEGFRAML
jgi:hypothetical protein